MQYASPITFSSRPDHGGVGPLRWWPALTIVIAIAITCTCSRAEHCLSHQPLTSSVLAFVLFVFFHFFVVYLFPRKTWTKLRVAAQKTHPPPPAQTDRQTDTTMTGQETNKTWISIVSVENKQKMATATLIGPSTIHHITYRFVSCRVESTLFSRVPQSSAAAAAAATL